MQDPATNNKLEKRGGKIDAAENAWLENAKTIIVALIIALVIRTFFFQPFNIPTGSMTSTLLIGDYLFVSKFSYGYSSSSFLFGLPPFEGRIMGRQPKRGDVVVFKNVHANDQDYIKRLVGLPGDEIQVIRGVLHINGEPVQRRQVGTYQGRVCNGVDSARIFEETLPNGVTYTTLDVDDRSSGDNTGVFHVSPGTYFMMGDNRDCSSDSRFEVGNVRFDKLVGKAEIIFFSADGQKAQLWQFWRWPIAIRYGRMFRLIR